ncbi:MAG: gliding motility lipoprotein GldH [Cyclobacteriaceae bacterium]
MRYFLLCFIAVYALSCDQNRVFEENHAIESDFWYVDSVMTFKFEILEAKEPYNLYANFSHSSDYNFHNLYYKYLLKDSTDREVVSSLVNINFFEPKSGIPFGSGLGDTFDHQHLILENFKFKTPGEYQLSFQQYMRTDSLPDILYVGARVERAATQ